MNNSKKITSSLISKDSIYQYGWVQLLPIIMFCIGIVAVMRVQFYYEVVDNYFWHTGDDYMVNYKLRIKMLTIIFCGIVSLIILFGRIFFRKFTFKWTSMYIPLFIYSVFVFLSFVFSGYHKASFFGWTYGWETTPVLLCYVIMFFYIVNTVNSTRDLKIIIYPTALISCVLSLIGIFQKVGILLGESVFFQKVFVQNKELHEGLSSWDKIDLAASNNLVEYRLFPTEIFTQTLDNPTPVGHYSLILLPVFIMMFFYEKRIRYKFLFLITSTLLIINIFFSNSMGVYFGLFIVFLTFCILYRKNFSKWAKNNFVLSIIIVIGIIIAGTQVVGELSNTFDNIKNENVQVKENKFDYFITNDNSIEFSYNQKVAFITIRDSKIEVKTKNNEVVKSKYNDDDKLYTFDNSFKGVNIQLIESDEKITKFDIYIDNEEKRWSFINKKNEFFHINWQGTRVKLDNTPHIGFENNPDFGTGRGYIWSRVIPMLDDYLLTGVGSGVFPLEFPQNDYVGKYNAGMEESLIVVTAHNIFAGTIINTGVPSLLAWLVFIIMFIGVNIKYLNNRILSSMEDFVQAGIFLGIVGSLMTMLLNEDGIRTMPTFYAFAAICVAININRTRKIT